MASFGHFSPKGNEYIFTDYNTPRPMMNYLWNARILSGVNQTGGGLGAYGARSCCYIDPDGKGRASIIRDGNRYFYVRDADDGSCFNPGFYPTKTSIEGYRCVHGLGYTTIEGSFHGVTATLRGFVNESDPCELWTVTLANRTGGVKHLKLYTFVEFQLDGYPRYSDANSYLRGRYFKKDHLLIGFNGAMECPHTWYNGFVASDVAPTAFETSRRRFIGVYGDIRQPLALEQGVLSSGESSCEPLCGVLEHTVVLPAGGQFSCHVAIGATDGIPTAQALCKKLFEPGRIDRDFAALLYKKEKIAEDSWIQTPDESINRFANFWLKQQVQLCAEVGRDTGKGFRDQLQDAWAVVTFNPALSRAKILEALRYEYSDGRCVRGWLPLDNHIYSDGPVWIAPTINAYLKETGDKSLLDEMVPYLDQGQGTVLQHMVCATRFCSDDTSVHGLVRSRDGDWNDSLNMTGLALVGESVWTSIAVCYALQNLAEIAGKVLEDVALELDMWQREQRMRTAINKEAWDGRWYLAAINDQGEKVGSHTEQEGQIYLNSQTWAILADVAQGERKISCLQAIDSLLDSEYGPLTLYPPYTKFNNHIGRLTSFVPGIWENGTPYCHGGTFKVVADCLTGRGDKAYETIKKILPDSTENPSSHSGCEPYALTNMYLGPANPRSGETLFAWVTGAAGWMFRAITQYLCGFTAGYGQVCVNPCIPAHWDGFVLRRRYLGALYSLTVTNKKHVNGGVTQLRVDGELMDGNVIDAFTDGGEHTIEAELG